jgi:hypothetical protein
VFLSSLDRYEIFQTILEEGELPCHEIGNWDTFDRFDGLLQWEYDDSVEFFSDFIFHNNLKISIHPSVCKAIISKCNGYIHATLSIY